MASAHSFLYGREEMVPAEMNTMPLEQLAETFAKRIQVEAQRLEEAESALKGSQAELEEEKKKMQADANGNRSTPL